MARNLFSALHHFHPREGVSPWENFLTEAVAYLLETQPAVGEAWLKHLLPDASEVVIELIETRREYEVTEGTRRFPDMVIEASINGRKESLIFEHKWDAPIGGTQLHDYAKIVSESIRQGHQSRLIFVGAHVSQVREAAASGVVDGVAMWRDLHKVLGTMKSGPPLCEEFADFLMDAGLGPTESLNHERLRRLRLAFETNSRQRTLVGGGIAHYLNRLQGDSYWDLVPSRMHEEVEITNRYGRVALEFGTARWRPCLTFGVMYSRHDHRVDFVSKDAADLILRLECEPDLDARKRLVDVLNRKATEFRTSGYKALASGDPENRNRHTLLIVQADLIECLGGSFDEDPQVAAMSRIGKAWIEILFQDSRFERQLAEAFDW